VEPSSGRALSLHGRVNESPARRRVFCRRLVLGAPVSRSPSLSEVVVRIYQPPGMFHGLYYLYICKVILSVTRTYLNNIVSKYTGPPQRNGDVMHGLFRMALGPNGSRTAERYRTVLLGHLSGRRIELGRPMV
jgi:hypothetical protein